MSTSWPRSESAAEKFFTNLRWPEGPICPYCKQSDPTRFSTTGKRKAIECLECLRQFRWTNNTIFHKHQMPILSWLKAIKILADDWDATCLVIGEKLDVSSKVGWEVTRKIQAAAQVANWEWRPDRTAHEQALSLAEAVFLADRKKVLGLLKKIDQKRPRRKSPTTS